MPRSTFEKFLPASGVLAGILFAIYGFLQKVPSDDKPGALTVLAGHDAQNIAAAIAGALFCVVMVFFAAGLRQALRSREPAESTYSSVAYGGALLLAAATGIGAWLTMALVEVSGRHDASSAQALGTLTSFDWLPWVTSASAMMLATGLGGLRNAVLPKWLAIVTVVLGVLCLAGPAGALVFIVSPLWFAGVGIVLARRQSDVPTTTPISEPVTA